MHRQDRSVCDTRPCSDIRLRSASPKKGVWQMTIPATCQAIHSNPPRLIRFYYTGDRLPGFRIVEPHMIALNPNEALCLRACFLSGDSQSSTQGFQEYEMEFVSEVTVLEETFAGPRPGYHPAGGTIVHSVQCRLLVPALLQCSKLDC